MPQDVRRSALHMLITGANRGIGLAVAELAIAAGYRVTAAHRAASPGDGLARLAQEAGARLQVARLDVTDPASIAALDTQLKAGDLQGIDVLVNNAGVYLDRAGPADAEAWRTTLAVNVMGPHLVTQGLRHRLRVGGASATGAKVVFITSLMGATSRAPGGSYAYRASKAACTNLACNLATDLRSSGIAVLAIHPGWVGTDMGGAEAPVSISESATGILAQIEALDVAGTGRVVDYTGAVLPL